MDEIPDGSIDRLVEDGFDWLWPLGRWQTGEAGRQVAEQPGWQQEYRELLPDSTTSRDLPRHAAWGCHVFEATALG